MSSQPHAYLPPDFAPPPDFPLLSFLGPPAFPYGLLLLWLLFPLHAPLTLLVFDAPFGKFALDSVGSGWGRWLNFHGNRAWAVMELVAPLTFIANLPAGDLSPRSRTLAALYLMHYMHRAIVSPLFLAPKRAPLHLVVVLAGVVFNYINATLLATALVLFPPSGGWTYYVGIALWALGFAGNVYHDEILHDLRRPKARCLVSTPSDAPDDRHPNGRYRVPHGGLFELVSFPNYLCEWIEWTGFAIAAAPTFLVPVPSDASLTASLFGFTFDMAALASVVPVPAALLAPPWAFVLAEVTSMLPRAIRGHRWYKDTFKTYPKNRKAVIPGLV